MEFLYGSECGSRWIRILLFLSATFKTSTKKFFFILSFFASYFFKVHLHDLHDWFALKNSCICNFIELICHSVGYPDRMFLGLPDPHPDPIVTKTDLTTDPAPDPTADPAPDPSVIKQQY
jgi:hypothetical protein